MSNLTEFIPTFETIKEGKYKFPNEPIEYYPIVVRVVPFLYADKKEDTSFRKFDKTMWRNRYF